MAYTQRQGEALGPQVLELVARSWGEETPKKRQGHGLVFWDIGGIMAKRSPGNRSQGA